MQELALTLDRTSTHTLTEQLYLFLKQEIMHASIAKNEKLPSKRQLALHLRCSVNTVEGAYNQLVDEGYLIAKEKSGYYVAPLEGILNLDRSEKGPDSTEKKEKPYRYDFSYTGVDLDHFPFQTYRRITREVINASDKDLLCMGESKGLSALRTNIARYLHHSRGVRCSASQIIVSSGTEYLMQLLIQLFDERTVYAIENPGYEKLNLLMRSNRVRYTPLGLDEHGLRADSLQQSKADVLCITPSHQFPTGCIMPVGRRLQLLSWAGSKEGRYILEDDYDSEFRYSGKPIPSLQGMDSMGKVIYMGSFSKSLSPSLRISYMVLPVHLCDVFERKLTFLNCPVPMIDQKVLSEFIERGHFERHLNRMRNLYGQKREALVVAITNHLPHAKIEGASAGLHLTLRLKHSLHTHSLVRRAAEYGVKVYGLSRYYSQIEEGSMDERIMLGFATMRMEDMEDAVALLKEAWQTKGVAPC
jgi:GntR family transcriptional regulator/MocR family aminotransferase